MWSMPIIIYIILYGVPKLCKFVGDMYEHMFCYDGIPLFYM